MIERLKYLISFIKAHAENGEIKYQDALTENHHKIYEYDIFSLKN